MNKNKINKTITVRGGGNIFIPKKIIANEYPATYDESFARVFVSKYYRHNDTIYENTDKLLDSQFLIYTKEEIDKVKELGYISYNSIYRKLDLNYFNIGKVHLDDYEIDESAKDIDVNKEYYRISPTE